MKHTLATLVTVCQAAVQRNAGRKPTGLDFRVYLFNLTNIDEWMNGSVEKLHVEELGPYVYQEIWTKKNITFHE